MHQPTPGHIVWKPMEIVLKQQGIVCGLSSKLLSRPHHFSRGMSLARMAPHGASTEQQRRIPGGDPYEH
ncbi:hypothetical protein CCMA1212_002534 [Trichoderma ghanense]|uniref:Uncharacterized protein n=1 Tax=Trichoderma ghanense TaxID=65468 RepID=A0ABY2HCX6_9HYPO